MRRRVITVPIDKEAEKALDYDAAKPAQLIERYLSGEEYVFLETMGLISLINSEGDSNIDDFEDDSVTGLENLNRVLQALQQREEDLQTHQYYPVLQELISLFAEAIRRGTGVYFFF